VETSGVPQVGGYIKVNFHTQEWSIEGKFNGTCTVEAVVKDQDSATEKKVAVATANIQDTWGNFFGPQPGSIQTEEIKPSVLLTIPEEDWLRGKKLTLKANVAGTYPSMIDYGRFSNQSKSWSDNLEISLTSVAQRQSPTFNSFRSWVFNPKGETKTPSLFDVCLIYVIACFMLISGPWIVAMWIYESRRKELPDLLGLK
jgi:hypothetical protein